MSHKHTAIAAMALLSDHLFSYAALAFWTTLYERLRLIVLDTPTRLSS